MSDRTRRVNAVLLVAGVVGLGIYVWLIGEHLHALVLFAGALLLTATAWFSPESAPDSLGSYLARVVRIMRREFRPIAAMLLALGLLMLWERSGR